MYLGVLRYELKTLLLLFNDHVTEMYSESRHSFVENAIRFQPSRFQSRQSVVAAITCTATTASAIIMHIYHMLREY